ncbi:MAG: hypothetical protein JSS69_05775 [Acidobacteria bacterium]|nr:hypothetical protein [Acidobacteriota bacterium]MBS1865410.1 hypothetical protein [Acidobacteriota bacterium]
MQRYRVVVTWDDRRWGPQMEKLAAEGTSARRALNNALLGFFSDKNRRKERREAHAHLRVEIWRVKKPRAA